MATEAAMSAKPQQQQTQQRWQQWTWQWSQDKGTDVWEEKMAINLIVQFSECYHFILQIVSIVLSAACSDSRVFIMSNSGNAFSCLLSNHFDFYIPIYRKMVQQKGNKIPSFKPATSCSISKWYNFHGCLFDYKKTKLRSILSLVCLNCHWIEP